MWLTTSLVTDCVLSTGWNAACWWLDYSKPPTCPNSGDRPLEPGRSFLLKASCCFSCLTQKWLSGKYLLWSSAISTVILINNLSGVWPTTLSPPLSLCLSLFTYILPSLSLFSPTSLALSFSVDKLSESLTTQPGKIARSHAARQVYPWPWFPLTTFPSAAK